MNRHSPRVRNGLLTLALMLVAVSGHAEPTGHRTLTVTRLDRVAVAQRALSHGAGMRTARVGVAAAARTRNAASPFLSLPPRLNLEVARHSYPGGAGMDVTAELWQDLSLGGLGAAKRGFAEVNERVRKIELKLAKNDIVHRAMLAWIDAWHGRALSEVRAKSVRLADRLVEITDARLRAGSVPPVELSIAASVQGAAKAGMLDAHGRVVEADSRLGSALGLDPGAKIEIVGDLTRSDDSRVDGQAVMARAQREHPLVKLAESHAHMADSAAELDASRGRPVIGVGVTYAHETTGDRILGAALSLPLPLVNPAGLEMSVARGQADVARSQVHQVRAAVVQQVWLALHEREHSRELRAALQLGAIIPGRDALREMLKRYEAGAVGLAETLAARRELLAVEEAYLAACADVHRADAELVYVAGGLR